MAAPASGMSMSTYLAPPHMPPLPAACSRSRRLLAIPHKSGNSRAECLETEGLDEDVAAGDALT